MKVQSIAVLPQGAITTERFVLRPVRRSDMGLYATYAGDRRLAEATRGIPHPLPPGAAEAFVTRAARDDTDEDTWVMDGLTSGLPEMLGVISLRKMDRAQSEVEFWVAPAFWNIGIASEAVNALVTANPQKNKTIFAEVFQDNPGSAKVLAHAGFEYLGDAESFCVARGVCVPTWTYLKKLD
jgi:RimJ/RimL family protein N-acetyltransferase